MSENMNVKVYIKHAGGEDEVRRFGVPEEVSTSFSYLLAKIKKLFDSVPTQLNVKWQDIEGDFITMSTDAELMEAIHDCIIKQEQTCLRLFVSYKEVKENGEGENYVHPGVECDGCSGSVIGSRFKCSTCFDFDLCSTCHGKGIHKHHAFNTLPPPSASESQAKTDSNKKNTHRGCPRSQSGPGRNFGGRGGPRMEFGRPPGPRCQMFGGIFPPGPQVFQWDGSNSSEFCGNMGAKASTSGWPFGFMGRAEADPKVMEEAAKFATQMASHHIPDIMKGIWTAWSGNQNQDKNESENIVPDINIDITVDKNGKKENFNFGTSKKPEQTEQKKNAADAEKSDPQSNETRKEPSSSKKSRDSSPEMIFMDVDDTLNVKQKKSQTVTPQEETVTPEVPSSTPQTEIQRNTSQDQTEGTQADDWTMINQDSPSNSFVSDAETAFASATFASAPDAPVVFRNDNLNDPKFITPYSIPASIIKTPVTSATTTPVAPSFPAYMFKVASDTTTPVVTRFEPIPRLEPIPRFEPFPNITSGDLVTSATTTPVAPVASAPVQAATPTVSVSTMTDKEKRICTTLQQLMQMGYSNEQGWLTKLVQIKNGDMNEVLDLLLPKK